MLFSLLLSLTQPADACGELMSVSSIFPGAGTMSVPLDSHFFLEMTCHSFAELPSFTLEQDGESVEVEVTIHERPISTYSNVMIVEVAPVKELNPDSMLLLSMEQFGMQSKVATFVTDEFLTSESTEDAPNIWWMEVYDVHQEEDDFECAGTLEKELYLDVSSPEEDDLMVRVYEVEPELRGEPLGLDSLQPFHEIHDPSDYDQRMIYIPAEKAEQSDLCFTATYVNAAGKESEPAPVQCLTDFEYMDDLRCGTDMGMGIVGCSSMPANELGWMALLMGTVGFVRRRR